MSARPRRRSPFDTAYNRWLEWLVLPLGDAVLRTELMRELRRWRRIERLSAGQVLELQREGLARVLHHATREVPYYRDLGVAAADDPYEWLARFPLLTKAELRSEGERLCTPGVDGLVANASSGSTGVQSTVFATKREMSRSMAIQTRWWEWAGYRIGDRTLQTGMTADRGIVKAWKDRLLRTRYVVAFGLRDADVAAVLRSPPRHGWSFLGGYASSLDAFARVASEEHLPLRFDAVASWGDKLYPHYRERIRSTFGARPLDTYGTTEGFMIAAQKGGTAYYVMAPHVVVELIDDDGRPVPPGEMGRVVVTRLAATSMPLIRFAIGDLAVAPAEPIREPNAPPFPQLERIIGRETDVLRSPEGRTLTVHTFTGVMEHFPEIEQFSVVPGEHGITMEYRAASELASAVLERAAAALERAIGERLPLRWKRVDVIPDAPSGKPQIIRQASGEIS